MSDALSIHMQDFLTSCRHLMVSNKLFGSRLLCVSFLFGILILSPSHADAKSCQIEHGATTVKLIPSYGKVTYNNGHSALQLGTKFGQHGTAAHRQGWITRGLTKTNLERHLNIRIKYQNRANNRICAALVGTTLRIGYEQFRVYVARSHKPGTCAYRTTRDHENIHVRIYQNTLKKYIPRLERKLRQSAARLKPIETSTPERAQNHFIRGLERDLQLILNEMNREMDQANRQIDTVANYKREQALCPGRRR